MVRYRSQNRMERADAQSLMWGGEVWLQPPFLAASSLPQRGCWTDGPLQDARRTHHAAASCNGQHFVPDKVKTNSFRPGLVEEECRCRLNDVPAQFVPRVALSENYFRQAFCAVAAVVFLNGLKHQIGHISP
jgi:hypothetical protein